MYDRQLNKTDNAEYLARIKELLDNRSEDDTSPYMVYLFNKVHEKYFGREVLNDATVEDAHYVGIDRIAEVISNGDAVAGTIYDLCGSVE